MNTTSGTFDINELLNCFADMVAEKLAEKIAAAADEKRKDPAPVERPNRRVSLREALEFWGISKTAYYKNREKYPEPHRVGKKLFWWLAELEQFAQMEMKKSA